MTRAVLLAALAGCGDNLVAIDAAVSPDAGVHCTAAFSGNFADSSNSDRCAMVSRDNSNQVSLVVTAPSTSLDEPLPVTIDLGSAPVTGFYSSETIASWSARSSRAVNVGVCVYTGGNAAMPQGSFQLGLAQIDAAAGSAHGDLRLVIYVLASPETDCGSGDTETIEIAF